MTTMNDKAKEKKRTDNTLSMMLQRQAQVAKAKAAGSVGPAAGAGVKRKQEKAADVGVDERGLGNRRLRVRRHHERPPRPRFLVASCSPSSPSQSLCKVFDVPVHEYAFGTTKLFCRAAKGGSFLVAGEERGQSANRGKDSKPA